MSAAHPIGIDLSEVDAAVEKIRRGESLTARERAVVKRRGEELLADELTDEPPPPFVEPIETTPEEDEDLLEAVVEEDANKRQGVRGTPWREYFAGLGIVVPPAE